MYSARLSVPKLLLLLLALIATASANAGLFSFGGDSWKEEVLLHDGQKIIVERSQTYGGSHEIGQSSPVKEHTIRFKVPKSGNAIAWISEYGEDVGRTNFNALALHLLGDTPYLIAEPNLCLSYNKWGRPNPPYVIFKHDGRAWQRIEMADLPTAFEKINLIVNNGRIDHIKGATEGTGYVSASGVEKINGSLSQPQYKSIAREAIENPAGRCGEMISDGQGGWIGIGWFKKQSSREACLNFCVLEKIDAEHCPCKSIFQDKQP